MNGFAVTVIMHWLKHWFNGSQQVMH